MNAKIAEDLSRGRINHAPHFMAMVRKTLEEPHVLMAQEAVERAKQHDRARLGLGIGPAAWMEEKYDDKGFIKKKRRSRQRFECSRRREQVKLGAFHAPSSPVSDQWLSLRDF